MKKQINNGSLKLDQFKDLYETYAPKLLFFARKFVDFQTAEDIVHDVFLKIYNNYKDNIGGYLFKAVQNSCLDYLKHQTIEQNYISKAIVELKILELNNNHTIDDIITKEQVIEIHKAISDLPEKCREIFILAYVKEKKHSEIAAQLNISVRTVESQIYKALKALRDSLLLYLFLIIREF